MRPHFCDARVVVLVDQRKICIPMRVGQYVGHTIQSNITMKEFWEKYFYWQTSMAPSVARYLFYHRAAKVFIDALNNNMK